MFISSHYTVEMPCEIEEIGAEAFHSHRHTAEILVLPKGSERRQGFHGRGPVCIQIYRSLGCGKRNHDLEYYKEGASPKWTVEVIVSEARPDDGWRDSEYMSDQHNTNLAKAILGAIEIAKHLREFTDQYEAEYQKAYDERQRRWDEEKAEYDAKLAADPAIGEEYAQRLLQRARSAVKLHNSASIVFTLETRGAEDRFTKLGIHREWNGPVLLRSHRSRINQDKAKREVAEASFRSVKEMLKQIRLYERKANEAKLRETA